MEQLFLLISREQSFTQAEQFLTLTVIPRLFVLPYSEKENRKQRYDEHDINDYVNDQQMRRYLK